MKFRQARLGMVHSTVKAQELGLIDGVLDSRQVFQSLLKSLSPILPEAEAKTVEPSDSNPVENYVGLLNHLTAGGLSKSEATARIAIRWPAIHRDYLQAKNPNAIF